MITDLRHLANAMAQDALHRLVEHHIRTGEWDRRLAAELHVADALLDLIDDHIRDMADTFDPSEGESFDPLPDIPLAVLTPDAGDWFAWPS